jgi:hypothetical protein
MRTALGLLVRKHRMRQFDDFGPDRFALGDKARVRLADNAVRLALGLLPQPRSSWSGRPPRGVHADSSEFLKPPEPMSVRFNGHSNALVAV